MHFIVLVIITFLTSASGLVVEIVAGRMMAPIFGMSLQTWTIVISVVLLGFSLGHGLGGRVADMNPLRAWAMTGAALLAASLTTLSAEWVLVALSSSGTDGLSLAFMTLVAMAAFFSPSFFVSYPTPFITKMAVERGTDGVSGRALGVVYGASSLGAIVGSISAGFYLVPVIGSSLTMKVMALLYLVLALYAFWRAAALRRGGLAVGAIALAVLLTGVSNGPLAGLCQVESAYYCMRKEVVRQDGRVEHHLILNQLVHAAIDPDEPRRFPIPYTGQLLWNMREHFDVNQIALPRILFVGGGGYTLPARIAALYLDAEVTVAEIDPAVTAFVRAEFPQIDLTRLAIQHRDGRLALSHMADASLDVIVLDAFSDIAVPEHLVTREFLTMAAGKLRANGIMLANIIDGSSNPKFLASFMRTARDAFPQIRVFAPVQGEHQARLSNYIVALAQNPVELVATDGRMRVMSDVPPFHDALVQTDDRSNVNFLVAR